MSELPMAMMGQMALWGQSRRPALRHGAVSQQKRAGG